ncbi:MAG: hypothetical protein M3Y37_02090 [Chloroflexota bacterium]|nr:hypothetical protein [Chloroflexota bacterium]
MHQRSGTIRIVLLAGLALAGAMLAASIPAERDIRRMNGPVLAPDSTVDGLSLGQWSARHWQWTLSFPLGRNPGQDPTGTSCGLNQDEAVFFIPRNFPPCQVPAGTVLFVPLVGTECSNRESGEYFGATEADLRACAAREVDRYTGLVVRLDGEQIEAIEAYRTTSPLFSVNLPGANVLGIPPGNALFVADGFQLIIPPLMPGPHELRVHVELVDGTVLPDKVLHLIVVNF